MFSDTSFFLSTRNQITCVGFLPDGFIRKRSVILPTS